MLQSANFRQIWLGVIFAAFGALALWELPRPIGSLSAMGPGYFPMLLGIGLLLTGAASVVAGLRSQIRVEIERLSLVPTFFIISGIVAMALLLDPAGLAVALLCMVAGTCYDRVRSHPLEVILIYLAVLGLTWFVFIYLIKVPIKLFW